MNRIVRVKDGFNFQEELKNARKRVAYYEEGLLIDVAARIVDAMESQGVNRSELARRLNVSPAYVTKILRGHANLSLESLAKLSFALKLKWECILIPRDAKVGVMSLAYESGKTAIYKVERATIPASSETISIDENAYGESTQKEVYHELRIPA